MPPRPRPSLVLASRAAHVAASGPAFVVSFVAVLTAVAALACRSVEAPRAAPAGRALTHEAYVWQRAWTGAVSRSVEDASPALDGLRVLLSEVEPAGAVVWPEVDAPALARAARPVTAVIRIDGARDPDAALAPALVRLDDWRRAGIDVVGLEIDHDAATAALPAYAAWLRAARPRGLRFSITALPAWGASPALADVAAAVDELVVQVHAVRAPRLFDRATARRWLEDVAAAIPAAHLRVALPTYAVTVGGERLAADPADVAAFVRDLERRPIAAVDGVVWFRLPTTGDRAAWSAPTLDAVIAGRPLAPLVEARLRATGPELHDVVLVNRGTVDGAWPALRIRGALTAVDLVGGYVAAGDGAWTAPGRTLAPGAETVVGWATGKDLRLDVP